MKLKLNYTKSCYANLHSVSDLQINMGRINLKYGQITMYNLIWNFTKRIPIIKLTLHAWIINSCAPNDRINNTEIV